MRRRHRIGQWELYDLEQDPNEMENLYHHPDSQEVVSDLKIELERLQSELGDDLADTGDRPNIGDLAAKFIHMPKN